MTKRTMSNAAAAVAMTVLVVLAVRADRRTFTSSWLVVTDVAVGVGFVVAAWAAAGPRRQRMLVGAVGPAWLAGSFVTGTQPAHQAVLALALLAFPAGRIRDPVRWLVLAFAVVVAFGLVPQLGVAAMFACVAAGVAVRMPRDPAGAWYPAVAAAAVAAAMAGSWAVRRFLPGAFHPTAALVAYEAVLLLVAAAFPVAARVVEGSRARLADRLVADARPVGLDGIAAVLGGMLGDPDLRVSAGGTGTATWMVRAGHRKLGRADGSRWTTSPVRWRAWRPVRPHWTIRRPRRPWRRRCGWP